MNDRPNTSVASTSMTTNAIRLVATLVKTRPVTYSEIDSGVANRFRKVS